MNRKDKHRPMWARVERRIHEQIGLRVDDVAPRAVVVPLDTSWERIRPFNAFNWAYGSTSVITNAGASWPLVGVRHAESRPAEAARPKSRYPTNRR